MEGGGDKEAKFFWLGLTIINFIMYNTVVICSVDPSLVP